MTRRKPPSSTTTSPRGGEAADVVAGDPTAPRPDPAQQDQRHATNSDALPGPPADSRTHYSSADTIDSASQAPPGAPISSSNIPEDDDDYSLRRPGESIPEHEARVSKALRLAIRARFRALTSTAGPFAFVGHRKRRAFCAGYAVTGLKAEAARLAGVSHGTNRTAQWQEDPQFQAGMKVAEGIVLELYEDEVMRRAVIGVLKPTGWYQGQPGALVRERSDLLTMFRMKKLDPGYRDTVTVKGSLATLDVAKLTLAQLARIAQGENPLAVLASDAQAALAALETQRAIPARTLSAAGGDETATDESDAT